MSVFRPEDVKALDLFSEAGGGHSEMRSETPASCTPPTVETGATSKYFCGLPGLLPALLELAPQTS
eukprot:3494758-Alexandrium_andersonii.AAC.1